MAYKLFRRPLAKNHQAAIRRVKDPDYWGLPKGTPIKPGMKPKGPKAKAAPKVSPAKKATEKPSTKTAAKTPTKKAPAKKSAPAKTEKAPTKSLAKKAPPSTSMPKEGVSPLPKRKGVRDSEQYAAEASMRLRVRDLDDQIAQARKDYTAAIEKLPDIEDYTERVAAYQKAEDTQREDVDRLQAEQRRISQRLDNLARAKSDAERALYDQPFPVTVASDLTADQIKEASDQLALVPEGAKQLLADGGMTLHFARRADEASDWPFTEAIATADGRDLGGTSHYDWRRRSARISVDADLRPGSGVVAHELGHALDDMAPGPGRQQERDGNTILVKSLHEDPRVIALHDAYIDGNEKVGKYYRLGSAGTKKSGLNEWIAESYAVAVAEERDASLSSHVAGILSFRVDGGNRVPTEALRMIFREYGML